ncbi:DUF1766-domain-containing protein [Zopfia rhizophila CBS 207.26]|uniref:DUF1766-domain-containing protein n=1 Tax=Zopfia rhizophila CBS 207.26 TaxID=1314779 RepID=A0A6A6DXF1_9PEZI|nr:DUF1766-domain-containing protein [Zopfia rhizophila CBS 207.26]
MTTLHRCFNNKGPEKSEGSASSYHTAESLTQDEKESWRLARKQLMEKGFTPAFIEQHLASIFTIMADIVDSDLADPVEDVDVNEHFGLKTANIPHEMGLIAIDNASTRSGNATESMSDNGLPIQQYLSGLSVLGYEASGGSHFLPLLKRNRPLTLSQIRGALLAATMKPILSHRRISGSIYLLRIHDGFEYVKIGMTYRNPLQRREEWKRQCPTIREYAQGYEYQTVPFPFRLEELIFTELRDKRARLYCIGCNIIHQEWFEASLEHVKRVIQKWTDWIEQNPYERESENTDAIWKLKSTIDYSKLFSISQPLENL